MELISSVSKEDNNVHSKIENEMGIQNFRTIDEYLNKNVPGLLEILRTTNIIITGSFVLYFKMRELGMEPNFNPDDIDIFYIQNNKNLDHSIINIWFYKTIVSQINKQSRNYKVIDNYNINSYNINSYNINSYNIHNIFSNIRYGKLSNNVKINLVQVNKDYTKSITEFINEYFDFDFCKCWYDGKSISTNYEENVKSQYTILYEIPMYNVSNINPMVFNSYINNIKNKNIPKEFNNETDPLKTFMRIVKYSQRGFTINTDNLYNNSNILCKKT